MKKKNIIQIVGMQKMRKGRLVGMASEEKEKWAWREKWQAWLIL